jgi:methylphosphotriester-DNA--protein-cysteine methyltransferase
MSLTWLKIVVRAKRYIDEHIRDVLTVDEVADHLGVDTSKLGKKFQEAYTISPKYYISIKKIDEVVNLLISTRFQEITYYYSNMVGYRTAGGVSNLTKRKTGLNFTRFKEKVERGWQPDLLPESIKERVTR